MKNKIIEQVVYLMQYNNRILQKEYSNVFVAEFPSTCDKEYNKEITHHILHNRILRCFGEGNWHISFKVVGEWEDIDVIDIDNENHKTNYTQKVLDKLLNLRQTYQCIIDSLDSDPHFIFIDKIYDDTPVHYSIVENRNKQLELEKRERQQQSKYANKKYNLLDWLKYKIIRL